MNVILKAIFDNASPLSQEKKGDIRDKRGGGFKRPDVADGFPGSFRLWWPEALDLPG